MWLELTVVEDIEGEFRDMWRKRSVLDVLGSRFRLVQRFIFFQSESLWLFKLHHIRLAFLLKFWSTQPLLLIRILIQICFIPTSNPAFSSIVTILHLTQRMQLLHLASILLTFLEILIKYFSSLLTGTCLTALFCWRYWKY
jgi:hypothetical protein